MEHRKHLIIPWNWNILNFFFSKILVKLELTSLWNFLWILKDFGYHNLTWKRRFNSDIFGYLTPVVNGVMMTGRVTKWIYEVIIDKMEFVKMSP